MTSHDLEAQLVIARDLVQTLDQALRLLDDTDLIPLPTASDRPRVSGSATPPTPYSGDPTLAIQLLAALRQCHDAAVILCDIDVCDDPLPWYTAPDPGDPDAPAWHDPDRTGDHTKGQDPITAIPPLADVHRHLEHLDAALADIQTHRDQLAFGDIATALHATDLLLRPTHLGGELQEARWHRMAKRARYECERCTNLSGRARICQTCARADQDARQSKGLCRNPADRTQCAGPIMPGGSLTHGLCKSCHQARRDAKRQVA